MIRPDSADAAGSAFNDTPADRHELIEPSDEYKITGNPASTIFDSWPGERTEWF
ncbi:hypothetical protein [Chitinimonas koreensis]|uniref:hypothetical protein n=1 Tax=Chitinimonas koreensis TaxID=356302 RepID=UPI001654631B|nr:hypothetical protein [Chitinimonas koreensis]QNM97129.1 hypothetical protein H9L41_02000 [Chitinimonas koreensis]